MNNYSNEKLNQLNQRMEIMYFIDGSCLADKL